MVDRLPVDARHVRGPEMVALQAPGLAEHLPPFDPGNDRGFDAFQLDPTGLAAGAFAVIVGGFLPGTQHAQAVGGAGQHDPAAAVEIEVADCVEEGIFAQLVKIVDEQAGVGRRCKIVNQIAKGTLEWVAGIEDLAIRAGQDPTVQPFFNGEGEHALPDSLQVDAGLIVLLLYFGFFRGRSGVFAFFPIGFLRGDAGFSRRGSLVFLVFIHRFGDGDERRG